jgi:glutamate racemase
MRFFREPQEARDAYITGLIREIKDWGGSAIVVYANSVCGYVDFDRLSQENDIAIITLMQAYIKIGTQYRRPYVWAVTTGALNSIEQSIWKADPEIDVRGMYHLDIGIRIEAGETPAKITEDMGLADLIRYNEKSGSDCIILGCTHFPYLKAELDKAAAIPVIDPADTMLEMLEERLGEKR